MKRILAVICLSAVLAGSFAVTRAESGPSSMRLFGAGKYTVGEDFQAGEYVLTAAEQVGSFAVSIDGEGLDVITAGSFDGNTILAVEDGDHLELIDCTAVWASDHFAAFGNRLSEYGGMLKVGANLLPGIYELVGEAGKMSGYRIFQDVRFRLVAEENAFEDRCRVRVSEGQYLELIYCALGQMIPADGEEAEPAGIPDMEAQDGPAPVPETVPDPEKASRAADSAGGAALRPVVYLSTATPMPPSTKAPTPKPTAAPAPEPEQEQGILDITDTAEVIILEPEPTEPPIVTRKVRIDKARTPAFRSIPSTQGEKIGVAEAGAEYELLDTEGKWYKIRLPEGAEGWITSGMAEIIE
ncbi:MAG: SH3 domain-containing protein [Clostridia bacterium]|nr:SH3 domain-containing protein [Clostridia bacterium]